MSVDPVEDTRVEAELKPERMKPERMKPERMKEER
jgi:hypothetical protein